MNAIDPVAATRPAAPAAPADAAVLEPVAAPRRARVPVIPSELLFADGPEIQIAHGDAVYRLRRTSLGKLILTK